MGQNVDLAIASLHPGHLGLQKGELPGRIPSVHVGGFIRTNKVKICVQHNEVGSISYNAVVTTTEEGFLNWENIQIKILLMVERSKLPILKCRVLFVGHNFFAFFIVMT
jgi:hypothetical protein